MDEFKTHFNEFQSTAIEKTKSKSAEETVDGEIQQYHNKESNGTFVVPVDKDDFLSNLDMNTALNKELEELTEKRSSLDLGNVRFVIKLQKKEEI